MWGDLPKSLNSHFGFQGCLSSLELNGEMIDPLKVVLKTKICCYLKQEKKINCFNHFGNILKNFTFRMLL